MSLAKHIFLSGHLNVYAMSENDQEYGRLHGLVNGEQKFTLSSEQLSECVREQLTATLGARTGRFYILHDGSDIRKPHSTQLEYLGTDALSLDHKPVRGYKTMNSVLVDADKQGVTLLCHELYSNRMPNYIGETTLNDPNLRAALSPVQTKMIADKTYVNTKTLFFKQAKASSAMIKAIVPAAENWHIVDRGMDNIANFKYIDIDLKDKFIIRAQATRKSHLTYKTYTLTGRESKVPTHYSLIDKVFQHASTYLIERIKLNNKPYENVTATIEWEPLILEEQTYTVVRITLTEGDKPIFKQPMLLITNGNVTDAASAKDIYQAYLLRAKIEVVFKFLKQNLGWETFQVRDFNSIKNLLAFAFFLVGFYDELKEQLHEDPLVAQLCALAHSKGKITIHFMLKGLQILAAAQLVEQWKKENNISQEQFDEFIAKFVT